MLLHVTTDFYETRKFSISGITHLVSRRLIGRIQQQETGITITILRHRNSSTVTTMQAIITRGRKCYRARCGSEVCSLPNGIRWVESIAKGPSGGIFVCLATWGQLSHHRTLRQAYSSLLKTRRLSLNLSMPTSGLIDSVTKKQGLQN